MQELRRKLHQPGLSSGPSRDFFNMLHISAVFQPLVSTSSSQITGFEALARFRNIGTDKDLSPAGFIPGLSMAEHVYLLKTMHMKVLQALQALGNRAVPISINVPPNLLSAGLADKILKTTPRSMIPFIKIEILEYAIQDWRRLFSSMLRLKHQGFGFYIDDFGTNHEHWQTLLVPGVEKIKFDKQFIPAGEPVKQARAVRFLDAWSSWINHNHIIAAIEGVEQDWEYSRVSRFVDEIQGYYTGRPAPLEHWLLR